jgi:hypothetical protein
MDGARRRGPAHERASWFRDVPFNAPLYRHLGFRVAKPAPRWLQLIRDEEDATILKAWPRVAMVRDL